MNIPIILITLIELDDVRVVHQHQNVQFPFQEVQIVLDFILSNRLDSHFCLYVAVEWGSNAHSAEVAVSNDSLELVVLVDV